jgi:Flp pilus assembly protein TadD
VGPLLLVALVTVAAYWPTLGSGFVAWDDNFLIVGNPSYRGLDWSHLRWMLTAHPLGHWVPLTWMSLALDHAVWGMRPLGYHLTSLALHVLNALFVFRLALTLLPRATALTGSPLRAAATGAALLFALHPLRVESVAWITERRDVLSGAFFLLTLLAYLRATGTTGARRRRLLAGATGLYALAVASKSIVMSLPAVLVLLDLYPLRRLPPDPRRWGDPDLRPVWIEKLPFAVLGAAAAAVILATHAAGGQVRYLTPAEWLAKAAYTLWFHVTRTLWPAGLAPLYELPSRLAPLDPPFLAAGLGALGLTALALALARRWPAGLALWAYFALTLAPVASFTHVGVQLTADRYAYLSGVGWTLLGGAGVGVAARAWQAGGATRRAGGLGLGLAAVVILGLGLGTWWQAHVWRSTETLWTHAVTVTPDCGICHESLGSYLMVRGRPVEGLRHLEIAAALRPDRPMAHGKVGQAHEHLGHFAEARRAYERELALRPRAVEARSGLGGILLRDGRPAEALVELRRAVAEAPDHVDTRTKLGLALLAVGEPGEAALHLKLAVAGRPADPVARLALARAYVAVGDRERARAEHDVLRTLDPRLADRLRTSLEEGATP